MRCNLELPPRLLDGNDSRVVKIHYRGSRAEEPVISETVRQFGVRINILHGHIEYIGGAPLGVLMVAIDGGEEPVEMSVAFIASRTERVEVVQ